MSRLSDIYGSYGNSFEIAVANTWSSYVVDSLGLPPSMMIISSPHDGDEDLGMHSILVTDADGSPVRLTYGMKTGNGLVVEDDMLKLSIDSSSMKLDSANRLSLDVSSIIDGNSIVLDNGTIKANARVLQTASKERFGVVKVDNSTIRSSAGTLTVETTSLDLANNASGDKGIIKVQRNSGFSVSKGTISVDTSAITKAGAALGISRADGTSTQVDNGILRGTLGSFQACTYQIAGLAAPDNVTTTCDSNNVLSADFSKLDTSLIKVDGTTLTVDSTGTLHIASADSIGQEVLRIGEQIVELNTRINSLEEQLQNYSPMYAGNAIFAFVCNGLASALLVKPTEYGELPEKMPTQQVSAEFTVRTNCPFKVYMKFEDNETPQIVLYQTNYNDIDIINGNAVFSTTFQSTENMDAKLKFSWLCKNYRSNNTDEYSKKTRITIEVRCADDSSILKAVKYSIVRYNSMYNTSIDYIGQNDELIIDKYKKTKKSSKNYEFEIARITDQDPESIEDGAVLPAQETAYQYPEYLTIIDNTLQRVVSHPTVNFGTYAFIKKISEDERYEIPYTDITITPEKQVGSNYVSTNEISVSVNSNGELTITLNS